MPIKPLQNLPLFLSLWHARGPTTATTAQLLPLAEQAQVDFGQAITLRGKQTVLGTALNRLMRQNQPTAAADGQIFWIRIERRARKGMVYRLESHKVSPEVSGTG